jgi:hypothetical protein
VYTGLRTVIGPRRISRFVEDLVRPHVIRHDLDAEYRDMSHDVEREEEAFAWAEATVVGWRS